ncbi:MAG: tRNA (5-methylaminomethyl-2-thiouridine)(34)-methyltransferase MnmD [Crocinitomicaceae bacterium]|nr:tRNA (5-methylaminomethyl-2-thiouridine)(34)-methyltransferase MnmD [Crocinitomicaceae bacterium]
MMKVIKTSDGSTTLYREDIDETYHSRHGAVQEALHVFIENGLKKSTKNPLRIFEMGFGTGLNAFLTLQNAEKEVYYTGLELYPIALEIIEQTEYWKTLNCSKDDFLKLHKLPWEEYADLSPKFHLRKMEGDLNDFDLDEQFDLIYFDAFGPRVQGELWEKAILEKIVSRMNKEAIFVTYCAKGQVRRDLEELGLKMDRLPGPPGKREMLFGKLV